MQKTNYQLWKSIPLGKQVTQDPKAGRYQCKPHCSKWEEGKSSHLST